MNSTTFGYLMLPTAFFCGAIPFGFIAGKMRGIDLREHGSKSIGATNTMRELGIAAGITVLLLDAGKGLLPVFLVRQQGSLGGGWAVAVGLCAVLGHIYSPFVRFRGGKGVATGLGVLIALSPMVAAGSVAVFAVTVALTRWVSLGSILGALTAVLLFFLLTPAERAYQLFGIVVAGFILFRHRSNIARLRAGTEPRLGAKKSSSLENTADNGGALQSENNSPNMQ